LGLSIAGTGAAGPFLTCDCTPAADNVTGFKIQFGSGTWIDIPAAAGCGSATPVTCSGTSKTICYDLATLPTGAFTVKARAKNAWAESTDSLPFSDTKVVPSGPTTTRIVQ
jgi:hypothetical protein